MNPRQSLIVLWLAGGPSQLETFDPHPGRQHRRRYPCPSKPTCTGIQLADGLPKLAAAMMDSIAVVRSLVSKEGDHERGTYLVKTGYRPDPTAVHPAIGAICCHELPGSGVEIPRHISILPGQWPARAAILATFDAFQAGDPADKIADVAPQVSVPRYEQRLKDLEHARTRLREWSPRDRGCYDACPPGTRSSANDDQRTVATRST